MEVKVICPSCLLTQQHTGVQSTCFRLADKGFKAGSVSHFGSFTELFTQCDVFSYGDDAPVLCSLFPTMACCLISALQMLRVS